MADGDRIRAVSYTHLDVYKRQIYYILGDKDIKQELELGREKPLGAYFGPLAKYVYVPLAVVVFILGLVYGGIG